MIQKHFQINRDFSVIIKLYNEKEYYEIHNDFRKSAWLTNRILDEHLQINEDPIKKDFVKML